MLYAGELSPFQKGDRRKQNCVRQNISRFFISFWKEYQTSVADADQAQLCELMIRGAECHMIMALHASFAYCKTNASHSIQLATTLPSHLVQNSWNWKLDCILPGFHFVLRDR